MGELKLLGSKILVAQTVQSLIHVFVISWVLCEGKKQSWLLVDKNGGVFSSSSTRAHWLFLLPEGRCFCSSCLSIWDFHNHSVFSFCCRILQPSHHLQLQKKRLLQITSIYLQVALQPWLTLPCHHLLALLHHHLQVLNSPLQMKMCKLVFQHGGLEM